MTNHHLPYNPWADAVDLLPLYDTSTTAGMVAWLEQRRDGIGSSDCSAVLGMNKWDDATPWHVFMDKTGQLPLDLGDSEQMEIGREVEGAIVRMVARRLGVDYVRGLPGMVSRVRPWQRTNLDAAFTITDDGPIPFEAKNTSEYLLEDWVDQIPDHAELQILHSMAVLDAPYGYVGGMVGGRQIVWRRVDRDPELIDHIITTEFAMWQRIAKYRELIAGVEYIDEALEAELRALEPPLTARDSMASIVGAAPKRDAQVLMLDDEQAAAAREWKARYDAAGEAEKAAKAAKAEARNNLARIADGHDVIAEAVDDHADDAPDHKVIARVGLGTFAKTKFVELYPDIADITQKKIEVLDVDALKREHPDEYRRCQARVVRGPRKNDPQ
ncbi:exonuclease [Gordonia phage Leonard]|uniref:Exonuclease n=1 Tax=Gordonia phage Leonard TaxID=2656539 RepID=A0A649VMY8_9CAUD|nr:RecE-like recombination exonuclease [Gordonia phage Phinally]YP_010002266.1 RecE-like recombination exonuclease [Gordonia phage Leonard]AMS03039.1 exonuclease [Gordonia phage Phinally]QGJ93409.1 exonuclease [Gordonia phage Leonard]